jgi:hypothetical protein
LKPPKKKKEKKGAFEDIMCPFVAFVPLLQPLLSFYQFSPFTPLVVILCHHF